MVWEVSLGKWGLGLWTGVDEPRVGGMMDVEREVVLQVSTGGMA